MESAAALAKMYLILLPIWLVVSLPIFIASYFVVRWMRRNGRTSRNWTVCLALVLALVVAPVLSPIISFLVPVLYVLVDFESFVPFLTQLLPWIVPSVALTFIVIYAVLRHM